MIQNVRGSMVTKLIPHRTHLRVLGSGGSILRWPPGLRPAHMIIPALRPASLHRHHLLPLAIRYPLQLNITHTINLLRLLNITPRNQRTIPLIRRNISPLITTRRLRPNRCIRLIMHRSHLRPLHISGYYAQYGRPAEGYSQYAPPPPPPGPEAQASAGSRNPPAYGQQYQPPPPPQQAPPPPTTTSPGNTSRTSSYSYSQQPPPPRRREQQLPATATVIGRQCCQ